MHHDSSADSNVGMVVQELKKEQERYIFTYITREDTDSIRGMIKNFIPFFIVKSYHLATSEYILQDDVFLPLSYLKFRKQVKDIQLWHGTGTIKKFGQDSNRGRLKELEKRANRNITHLIINSGKMKKQYSGAFGIEETKVFPYGLPRTDTLFDKNKLEEKTREFYKEYPLLKDKKLILYAPTFRDEEAENPKIELEIDKFLAQINGEFVLGLKLHPFVAQGFSLTKEQEEKFKGRLYDFSHYKDLNTLLAVSEMLITDYSSIVFEYCLQGKPMIFYAYDLKKFSDLGRGFYKPYNLFVPGPIAETTEELIELIKEKSFDYEKIEAFKMEYYEYLDGKSTQRITKNIFR